MGYYKKLETNADSSAHKTGKANRKLLAFIVCFLISVLLWTIIALNKNYKSKAVFTINTATDRKIKVSATVSGEGFDLMKEKLFGSRLEVTISNAKTSIATEKYLRDNMELNDDLKYSNFTPETIK